MNVDLINGFHLGPWLVLPMNGDIQGASGTTHLEPKVMEVLVALARQPGQVIQREALLREIWGARGAVSDEPLTRCIAELRRSLGDSRQAPLFIQTIPKRGYRLISSVLPLDTAVPPAVGPAMDPSVRLEQPAPAASAGAMSSWPTPVTRLRVTMPAAFAVSIVALGLIAWAVLGPDNSGALNAGVGHDPIARNTIAVLPFVNAGASPDDELFGEGLADEILNRLDDVEGLKVVARTSSFLFKNSTEDVRGIANRLRVAHVLEGSVRRSGDRMRINLQLVDASRGYELWSDSYAGDLSEIFRLQDDIANAIVTSLQNNVPTLPAQAIISSRAPTSNVAAYELMLRGRAQLNRRDEQSLRRSIGLFRQAIELDGKYGDAYVELAKAYVLLPTYSSELPDEMFDIAMATLAAGIEQDTSVDQSMQGLLALIAYLRWDWTAAEIAFRRALEHSANNPDVLVWYSQFLASVGRTGESLRQAQRAREVDLLSPIVNHRLSVASLWADEDMDASRYAELAEEFGMEPTANPDSYIVLKLRLADYDAVRPMLIGVQTMFGQPTAWVDLFLDALAFPGQNSNAVLAISSVEESRDIARKYLFGAWVYLGEADRALATALQLINDRPSFSVEFLFSREARVLREHPRFGELTRAIGLNRYWDQFGWPEACSRNGEDIVCH